MFFPLLFKSFFFFFQRIFRFNDNKFNKIFRSSRERIVSFLKMERAPLLNIIQFGILTGEYRDSREKSTVFFICHGIEIGFVVDRRKKYFVLVNVSFHVGSTARGSTGNGFRETVRRY